MTFRELGLITPILSALHEQGYRQPSPIQEKAIPPALEGRDVLGCAQTGTGKTCAFAVPILQRLSQNGEENHPIRALILTPTRELAIQIGESFEAYGKKLPLRTAVIFGGVGQGPQVAQLKKGVDILVATPGRLGDLYQQKLLDLSRIEIFVLDEADRMLDMGFIHDVKKILKWLPQQKQTLLFSATMPPEITELVNSLLRHPVRVAVNPVSSAVEVIEQSVYFVDKGNKTALLAHLVRELEVRNALVFTRTKHGANKVARDLEKSGISAAAIHGNKSQTARQQALADFKAGKVQCLVATDIAARGLDIEELSHVFNYNLSEVPETYVHRIGRTGRAGRGGQAIAFCDFSEQELLKEIEKLMGRTLPVVEEHPFPMEHFELPKRDKRGRIINEEDAEARAAARELRRTQDETRKAAAKEKRREEQSRDQQALQALEEQASVSQKKSKGKNRRKQEPAVEPSSAAATASLMEEAVRPDGLKKQRNKGKKRTQSQSGQTVEIKQNGAEPEKARPKLTRPGSHMDTGDAMPMTEFYRPNPLEGDRIMDATARLLAPRRGSLITQHPVSTQKAANPGKKNRNLRQETVSAPPTFKDPAQAEKAAQSHKKKQKGKGQRPAVQPEKKQTAPGQMKQEQTRGRPQEAVRSGHTKDSTEQKSLMKPYYLSF